MVRLFRNKQRAPTSLRSAPRPCVRFVPRLEGLEERCQPSTVLLSQGAGQLARPDPQTTAQVANAYGQLPLSFEANQGQAAGDVRYLARAAGYTLLLTPTAAAFRPDAVAGGSALAASNTSAVFQWHLDGANAAAAMIGLEPQTGTSNYLQGQDATRWITGVAHDGRVQSQQVYPGIDLAYYGRRNQLEYDFLVAPGADPAVIRLAFPGNQITTIDTSGNLVIRIGVQELIERAPMVYQDIGRQRQTVAGHYTLDASGEIGFAIGAYDARYSLTIDPVVAYNYQFGGSLGSPAGGIAVDSAGNAYVTGNTTSLDFPTVGAFQGHLQGGDDAFVAKLDPTGTRLIYSTYLGGSDDDGGSSIALDAAGNAYVAGTTRSTDFPTVHPFAGFNANNGQVFISELNAQGNGLIYSSYVDASGKSFAGAGAPRVALGADGAAYLVAETSSNTHVYVTKVNSAGTAQSYVRILGGSATDFGFGIAVDPAHNAYVTGYTLSTDFPTTPNALQPMSGGFTDAFVVKLDPMGAIAYSTYLGGNDADHGLAIAVDSTGSAYVTGETLSNNFPTANAFQPANHQNFDAFVAKINPAGSALVYSTFLGGNGGDGGTGIAVDAAGDAYVLGTTESVDFPFQDPFQVIEFSQAPTVFISKLNATGTVLLYSTAFGKQDNGFTIVVDGAGNAYVAGSIVIAVPDGTGQTGFVLKVTPDPGIVASGPDIGGGPDVRVLNAKTGLLIREIVAYNPAFTGGVRVALGDVTGDGVPDIITAPGPGGGPDIRVFDGATGQLIREFFAYNPGFTGGVRVALGDVSGDTTPDIITAPGPTGGPDIRVYDFFQTGFLMREFFAYNPGFTGGVYVAAADLDGDGRADIITSPGAGGGPDVRVYSGATGAMIRELIAYSAGFTGGVRVATVDVNGDGVADIITSPGMTGGPDLRAFDGKTGAQIGEFLAYDAAFLGGVFVGGA